MAAPNEVLIWEQCCHPFSLLLLNASLECIWYLQAFILYYVITISLPKAINLFPFGFRRLLDVQVGYSALMSWRGINGLIFLLCCVASERRNVFILFFYLFLSISSLSITNSWQLFLFVLANTRCVPRCWLFFRLLFIFSIEIRSICSEPSCYKQSNRMNYVYTRTLQNILQKKSSSSSQPNVS